MAERVQVIAPDGTRGSVDAKDVGNLPDGARVLTKEEIAEEQLQAKYETATTGQKIAGAAGFFGPVGWAASALGDGALPPQADAYREGVARGATAGVYDAVAKTAADTFGGPKAGKGYAEHVRSLEEAFPTTSAAGELVGMASTAAAGGGAGVARAIPGAGIAAAGGVAEAATARALGGLATRGAVGKAATQAASMAVRGAAEGGAYAGISQTASDYTQDRPIDGEKLYAVIGHGALGGAAISGGLSIGTSLVGAGVRGAVSSLRGLTKTERAVAKAEATAAPVLERQADGTWTPMTGPRSGRELKLSANDLDAGLREPTPGGERPLSFGKEIFPPGEGPSPGRVSVRGIDDAVHAPMGEASVADRPVRLTPNAPSWLGPESMQTPSIMEMMQSQGLKKAETAIPPALSPSGEFPAWYGAHNPKKGPSKLALEGSLDTLPIREELPSPIRITKPDPGLKISEGTTLPREVSLRPEAGVPRVEATPPISIPSPARIDEVASVVGRSDAQGFVRGLAQEQAWKAVGSGFGLQTTRFAKEAARYFPNGTRDLGEVALRYGLVDTADAALSPTAAAWQAAKTGTAADIAPRAAAAADQVGAKIGAITDASGARVELTRAMSAVDDVVKQYSREAGRGPLVNAVKAYGDELMTVLRPGRDGKVSVQDLLAQRKILDDIVFEEAKTLDPRGRVKALREVRSKLENVITDALDEASGKLPGAQRAEYKALKKDYHALRILSEAAEDSAARATKGATFGLTDKIIGAAAGSVGGLIGGPIGGLVSGPAAAFASKVVRERGNAAAAAFLSRAAEQGTIQRAVAAMDQRIASAAAGVLSEKPKGAPTATRTMMTARQRAEAAAEGRAAQAQTQRSAQAVVKWAGDVRADPEKLLRQVEEAASIVGRNGGPQMAGAYTASTLRALSFILGHIPAKERRDPLDPRSTPPLSHEEASRLLRATKYGLRPMTVFDDFERGVITPEGLRAAKVLAPESFAEFQSKLWDQVQDHMVRKRQLTGSQRLAIGKLLDFPASPDQRPDTLARLQQNLMPAPPAPPPAPPTGGQPVNMTVQQSGFDGIEARLAG